MLKRIRILGLALVAICALSAVVAVAAQATEAPFYKVAGSRLKLNETREISTHAGTAGFSLTATGKLVKCSTLVNTKGSVLLGSTGAGAPGKSNETLEFSGCTVTGNGTPCEVTEPIKTTPLVNELALSENLKSFVVEFKPATGTEFTTLKFTGTGCTLTETKVTIAEGSAVIGQAFSGGTLVEVGKEPAETKDAEINFPSEAIKVLQLFNSSEKEEKVESLSLKAFGLASTFSGRAIVLLQSGSVWGVS
jgi:hypothetical protein